MVDSQILNRRKNALEDDKGSIDQESQLFQRYALFSTGLNPSDIIKQLNNDG